MYNYKLARGIIGYAIAGAFFLCGCSRIEEMARKNDEDANIRMAVMDLGKKMEKAEKGMKRLEDSVRKKFK